MISTTTATLECEAQVSAALATRAITGAPASASRALPSNGAFCSGSNRDTSWCRASSSRPRPISVRPRSRARPGS